MKDKKLISETLFLIMARLNSERIKFKMVKSFLDSTLLDISIKKFLNCKSIPKENIYLAAHEPELLSVGKNNNINVFKRSYESSVEERSIKVLYDWNIELGKKFKYYVMINPCCPFLKEGTIEDFLKTYLDSDSDGMFGVVKKRNMIWGSDFKLVKKHEKGRSLNTKDLDFIYEAANCLYAGRIDRLSKGIHMGTFDKINDPELYIMDDGIELFDIDYPWQFTLAEQLSVAIKNGEMDV